MYICDCCAVLIHVAFVHYENGGYKKANLILRAYLALPLACFVLHERQDPARNLCAGALYIREKGRAKAMSAGAHRLGCPSRVSQCLDFISSKGFLPRQILSDSQHVVPTAPRSIYGFTNVMAALSLRPKEFWVARPIPMLVKKQLDGLFHVFKKEKCASCLKHRQ